MSNLCSLDEAFSAFVAFASSCNYAVNLTCEGNLHRISTRETLIDREFNKRHSASHDRGTSTNRGTSPNDRTVHT